jgi:hypothetical protein
LNPWQEADIGKVGTAGSSLVYADTNYTVQGAGSDIGGKADSFHYVYQPLQGDGWIYARVSALEDTAASAKAGVMIRENLTAGSKEALVALTPSSGSQFVSRIVADGSSSVLNGPNVAIPSIVYLERVGVDLNAWVYNPDTDWVYIGTSAIAMDPNIFIGLAITSGDPSLLTNASFDTVSLFTGGGSAPGPGMPPPPADSRLLLIDDIHELGALQTLGASLGHSTSGFVAEASSFLLNGDHFGPPVALIEAKVSASEPWRAPILAQDSCSRSFVDAASRRVPISNCDDCPRFPWELIEA